MAASPDAVRRAALAELARRELARREQAKPQEFVGPTQEQAGKPNIGSLGTLPGIAKAWGDVLISGARYPVNKLSATAAGVIGAIDPNDTYMAARDRAREEIATDKHLVHDDRLRTPEGEQLAGQIGNAMRYTGLPQVGEFLGKSVDDLLGPEARDVSESAATLLGSRFARRTPELPSAEDVVARNLSGKSAGAAAAATDISGITPELRRAISTGDRRGISAEALQRHVEAETLPVPIRLTGGEATGDVALLSNERNLRGKHTEMAERMNETNKRLGQNIQALRDELGQDVFSTNMVEHGDTLIAAYRAKDAAAQAKIGALYKQLRDANGGQFPVDARSLLNTVGDRLHQALLLDHAPKAVMATLNRLAKNDSMTFENFESLRTNLARIQRSSTTDGNEVAAAGIIRNAMEELPIRTIEARGDPLAQYGPGNAEAQRLVNQQYKFTRLKKLADEARAAARQHFQELEADPAYKAAVDESVPPDRFVRKFVIGAPRDQVSVLMRNLDDVPNARQTIGVAVLDYLRDAARLDQNYGGNFSATGYSRALTELDPKANILFDSRTAETLGKLRNVANYSTFQPRGSFVNNSNTLVGALAKPFLSKVPYLGPVAEDMSRRLQSRRLVNESLKPGAGISSRGVSRRQVLADELKKQ